MRTRKASEDRYEEKGLRVCVCCHKLPQFCTCGPDAVPTCPICGRPEDEGEHYPQVQCWKEAHN